MQILKVLSRLLDYPNEDAGRHQGDVALAISNATEISPDMRSQLLETMRDIYQQDLLEAEEKYSALFDQGRALSLHLFEHVHGESRDRGQAMVELMQVYEDKGLTLDQRELPDFIPLFLEFLSRLPAMDAREWLADVSPILARLAARLRERQSSYANLFAAMLMICGQTSLIEQQQADIANEERDDTPEALDREWEEAAVTFSPPDNCSSKPARDPNQQQALNWVDPVPSHNQQPNHNQQIGGQR
jgi:nitrate reductase delta subunit